MDPKDFTRFEDVQEYLQSSPAQHVEGRSGEVWEWVRVQYHPIIRQHARRMWWVGAADRERELWPFLFVRLRAWNFDPARGSLEWYIALVACRAVSDAERWFLSRPVALCDDAILRAVADPDDSLAARLEQNELHCGIHEALDVLDASGFAADANLLRRHWFDKVSLADVARETGVNAECIRYHHARALKRLKAILLRKPWRGLLPDWALDEPPRENPHF